VRVGPDDIRVEPVDEVSGPDIALQLDGALDGGELILDFDVLIMHNAARGDVPYSVRLKEGQVELHLPRVAESTMLGMESVGEEFAGIVRRD
jgi:hypothetical protein